jgi:hypothetical protein
LLKLVPPAKLALSLLLTSLTLEQYASVDIARFNIDRRRYRAGKEEMVLAEECAGLIQHDVPNDIRQLALECVSQSLHERLAGRFRSNAVSVRLETNSPIQCELTRIDGEDDVLSRHRTPDEAVDSDGRRVDEAVQRSNRLPLQAGGRTPTKFHRTPRSSRFQAPSSCRTPFTKSTAILSAAP